MSETKKPKNIVYWINTAIVLFCFFGFGLLPEVFGLSYAGMRAIGIFIGLLWGWITIEFGWVSLLGIIAMGTTGAMSITEVISTSFLSTMFLMLVMPMILMAFLDQSGFSEWIAYKLLALDFLKGRPWRVVAMIFVVASFLGFTITTFPMAFLMWSIIIEVAELSGYKKGDRLVGYLISGVVMLASVIVSSIPWGFYPIMVQGLINGAAPDFEYPFLEILILGIIGQIITVIVYFLIGKYILKIDVSKLKELPNEFYEKSASIKLTKESKLGAGLMVAFVLCMSIPVLLPSLPFSPFLTELGLQGVSIMLLGALLLLRDKNGKPYANASNLAARGLSWEVLFLVVSTSAIAALLKVPEVGVMDKLTYFLIPLVSELPSTVFVVGVIVIFWVMTQLTHNMVIVLTMIGALSGVCVEIGINPWVFGWMFMITMNFAYSTPAASSPGAMFYAHEWVAKKDAYICGILYSVLCLIAFLIIMLPITNMVFGSL